MNDRFWSKVSKSEGCWEWTGSKVKEHGHLRLEGVHKYAHRHSWELHNGPIPEGMEVRHRCDNPPCVNPSHLELGTHADNMRDMVVRGRSNRGEGRPLAKLTEADVESIRDAKGKVSQRVLAERYSVSQSAISRIQSGHRWRHTVPAQQAADAAARKVSEG